jgi:competence protein ComGC
MEKSTKPRAADRSEAASPWAATLVVLMIAVCLLSCILMLTVPTSSLNATTVYRGF